MNPTAIPPTALIRRPRAKRWHIAAGASGDRDETFCGQLLRWPVSKTAYNAAEVTCDDCLVAAIRRAGDASKDAISRGPAR